MADDEADDASAISQALGDSLSARSEDTQWQESATRRVPAFPSSIPIVPAYAYTIPFS